ncbi:MAG: hypothetical protein Q8Q92_00160 [bacterium]|nr:hypothetical protein [bacterium]
MSKSANKISRRIKRQCVVCGKDINVIVYTNGKCRNGHYFGKIPLYTKKAWNKAKRTGTHEVKKVKMGGSMWKVMNKDPKPYKYTEYWECAKCYWRK